MVPKDKQGNWKTDFDPMHYDTGFIEGNGAQFTWFVPHNLPELFEMMGGADSAVTRLNREFEMTREFGSATNIPITKHLRAKNM
jgi:putative alpha-1,2-mannosidase